MSLILLGISHRTAPIELRERLALPAAALAPALELLAQQPGVREGMILSTCNRVEILVVADDGAAPDLLHFLALATGQASLPPVANFYRHADADAARHVFRVAASLDSLVVGEPQILGQLKQAFAAAQAAGLAGPELEAVAARAFHAAKRVRSETAIAQLPVSVSQMGVDLARQIFGALDHKTVLLVGAGAMGQEVARHLMRQGAQRLLVANRTVERARALAAKFGGEALALEELRRAGDQADIVVTCAGAPEPLISRADAAHFLARRRGRPMLFLDLAVPRDVAPEAHRLENAFVYNVDDLDQVVEAHLAGRRQEAEAGERIVAGELDLFLRRQGARDAVPTLRALQSHAESLRAAEWERMRRRLGALTPEQEAAVEALTRSLMQKWLHHPLVELKEAATAGDGQALADAVHRLFGLPRGSGGDRHEG
jgi:glutamyl-tRNA reductase